jgi:photosystem II stability/assembly factor-like uncharacterized protein
MRKNLLVILSYCLITSTMGISISSYRVKANSLNVDRADLATPSQTSSSTSWTSNGPFGGYIYSLSMAASNPDVIYAGTKSGVFKTIDGADNWTSAGLAEMRVRVVKVDPTNPNVVYAGTDDGLYISEDSGSSWTSRGLDGARVNAITIDPNNSQTIYVGTGEPWVSYAEEIVGIFKSTNGGSNWETKYDTNLDAVAAILIDTNVTATVYAGIYTDSGGPGFLKSINGGDTWEGKDVGEYWPWDNIAALAMTPAGHNPPVIFAVNIDDTDVFTSTDGGESWTRTNVPWISPSSPWAVTVDPNDPDLVYVATHYKDGDLYRSKNGGGTWETKVNGLPPSIPASLVIDPRNSDVYAGLYEGGGVYKSTDEAESWNGSSQGFINTTIEALAIHPTSSNTVFAVVNGYGHTLSRTINGGGSWDYLDDSPDSPFNLGAVAISSLNPYFVIAGDGWKHSNSYYIYKTSLNGDSWEDIQFLYCSLGGCTTGVSEIVVSENDSNDILVGTSDFDGILARTTDGGQSWDQIGPTTTALAVDPHDPNVVYHGKAKIGQVFKYSNVWGSWSLDEITPSEGIGDVRDIDVDGVSNVYVAADDGLWRWNGSNWTHFNNLSTDDLTALAVDRSSNPVTLYIGTGDEGIFISQDGGDTWTSFNDGLGALSITELVISSSQPKMLYAGTSYGGVWSLVLESAYFIYLPFALR